MMLGQGLKSGPPRCCIQLWKADSLTPIRLAAAFCVVSRPRIRLCKWSLKLLRAQGYPGFFRSTARVAVQKGNAGMPVGDGWKHQARVTHAIPEDAAGLTFGSGSQPV